MHPADRGSGPWPLEIQNGMYNFESWIPAGRRTGGGLCHHEDRFRFCSTREKLGEIQLD